MATTLPPRTRYTKLTLLCLIAILIVGCGSPRKSATVTSASHGKGGGYYMDDGPGDNIPPGIEKIPDAVPRIERHNPANFQPYTVLGQRFVPIGANTPLNQQGVASWYGRKFHGQKTANGETYDMYSMTAAHPTLPLPSYARVTHVGNGRSVIVRVNDRGPFLHGRVIDLSYAAAAKLGIIGRGSDVVRVEAITHADIRNGLNLAASTTPSTPAPAQAALTRAAQRPVAASRPAPARPVAAPQIQLASAAGTTVAAAPSATLPTPTSQSPTTMATPSNSGVTGNDSSSVNGTTIALANDADSAPGGVTPDALAALNPQAAEPQAVAASSPQAAEPQTARRTPKPTVTDEPADGIYLQFAAFGSYISADQLVNRVNTEIAGVEGRNAHISTRDNLHRVRLGPYPSRTAAVNAAVRIQEATGMQPMLAQR